MMRMSYSVLAPKKVVAKPVLPASKSISNRALIMSALAGCSDCVDNRSCCDDTDVLVEALSTMPYEIDIKAAGTAMRFLTAFLSVTEGEHVITGTERMKRRPIAPLVNALRQMGADIEYVGEEGFPPLKIRGKHLRGGEVSIPGNVSSQYISALLMVGPLVGEGLCLKLTGEIISKSYIDMTLGMMRHYGARAEWADIDEVMVYPQSYSPCSYHVENDWSAASYWFELMALLGNQDSSLTLSGLMDGSLQGDSVVRYIYSLLGVKSSFVVKELGVVTDVVLECNGHVVPRFQFDFSKCPDLAQTVVCTCCGCGIPFHVTGLSTLKIKETDRIIALQTELRKLGFVVESRNDSELMWDGSRCEATMEAIDTYEDHRMAMAFAPLAVVFPGLRINNPEVVTKSYPGYWEELKKTGFVCGY